MARTRLAPNHLTAARLATAIASAILLGTEDHRRFKVAAALFLISFILDRADGELARQTGKCSTVGHRFDLCSDYTANVVIFLGLGVGLRSVLGDSAIVLGLLAALGIVAIFALVDRIERMDGLGAMIFPSFAGFDPDDAMIVVPIGLWCGGETYILVAAAIGAPSFFAWTCWQIRRQLPQLRQSLARRTSVHQ